MATTPVYDPTGAPMPYDQGFNPATDTLDVVPAEAAEYVAAFEAQLPEETRP